LGEMLNQLKVNMEHVSYFFNFDMPRDELTEASKEKKARKPRKSKKDKPTIGI
jgi:hypothetical protein